MAFSMFSNISGSQLIKKPNSVISTYVSVPNVKLGNIKNIGSTSLTSIVNNFSINTSTGTINNVNTVYNSTSVSSLNSDIIDISTNTYNSSNTLISYPSSRTSAIVNSYLITKARLKDTLGSICQGDINIRCSSIDVQFSSLKTGTVNNGNIINSIYTCGDSLCTTGFIYDSFNNPTVLQINKPLTGGIGRYNTGFTGNSIGISTIGTSIAGYYADYNANIYDISTNGVLGEFLEVEFPNPVILKQLDIQINNYARTPRISQFFGTNLTNESGVPISFSSITSPIIFKENIINNYSIITFMLNQNDVKYKYIRYVIRAVTNHWVLQLLSVSMLVDF